MSAALRLSLRLEDDALAAWLRVGEGTIGSRETLLDFLAGEGITAGLDGEALDRVVARLAVEADDDTEECIARGLPAQDATPDTLELVEPLGPLVGRFHEDGRVDFRERRLIVPVKSGERLGRIVPGHEGAPGFDVKGNTLPCRPAPPFVFRHGDGIQVDDDGQLVATRSGARSVDRQGRLDVVALHVHAGSVDLESGNLETEGSLEIKRDVASRMHVRAGVDLVVRGTVDAARVESGGSIEIGGGIIGGEGGLVRAGGDLSVGHVQSGRIFAAGTLSVARGVLNSELHAAEIAIGGAILGGRACAETSLVAREAGSPDGGSCQLIAAHPFGPGEDEAGIPRSSAAARESARAKLRGGDASGRLAARKSRDGRPGRGPRPTEQRAASLVAQQGFRHRQRELQATARIVIQGTVHAGCRIDFGGRPLVLEKSARARCYRFDVESGRVVAGEI
ncbi:MAG: FapA family protein [Myxococcota bacterium]